jgi:type I restriction enzyme M protein
VILANPPFKGSLDFEDVHPSLLRQVKTKKTELLFVALILRMLKNGGRSATIVPDGALFGSSGAHRQLRELLVQQNQLEAVISLPSGVFKPYAGVSTGILIFTKGGRTDNVFFYDVQADGLSLDDKRDPVCENDLPDCLERWKVRNSANDTDRSHKGFFVPRDEIRETDYDLSFKRYRKTVYTEEKFDPPLTILSRIKGLNDEIATITFTTNAPPSALYNSTFTVAAKASSNLAVTLTASESCTNVGGAYTMTSGTGTVR